MESRKYKMYGKKNCKELNEGLLLTKSQTDRLIELYRADAGLWDMYSNNVFHNKDNRKKALQYIADKLKEEFPGFDATVDQLQYKLSNIRGYYTRELSKIRKSQRNGTDYISTWRLFDVMDSFLRSHIIPRKAPAWDVVDLEMNYKTEPDDYETDEDVMFVHSDEEHSSHSSSLPIHWNNIHSDQGFQSTQVEQQSTSKNPPTSHTCTTESNLLNSLNLSKQDNDLMRMDYSNRIKRPRLSASHTMVTEPDPVVSHHESRIQPKSPKLSISQVVSTNREPECLNKENVSTSHDREDEDMLFARYIAMELRKITDARTKAFVKFKIHSIMYEAQTGAFS